MAAGLELGALSGRIELEDYFSSALAIASGKLEQFDHQFGGVGQRIAEQATAFFSAQMAIQLMTEAFHIAVAEIEQLSLKGAEVADVTSNFNHLTESAGRLGSTLLDQLRKGTHNTIEDLSLMKSVNADLAVGIKFTDEQFRIMAEGAFALAQAKGIKVADAFETINSAMITGRTRAIALQFGKIDLAAAEDKLAISLGTVASKLTVEEKLEASRRAMLDKVGDATKRLGEQTDGLDERVAQAQVAWGNFQDELGKSLATSPVIMAGLDGIKDALTAAFGGKSENLVKAVTNAINQGAIQVLEFAKTAVNGAALAGIAWNAFNVDIEASVSGFQAITYAVEKTLLVMLKISSLGTGLFSGAIAATEKDLDRLYNSMAEGENRIAKFKKGEEDWAVQTGHLNEEIEKIRQRMVDAAKAAEDGTPPINALTDAHKGAAKAAAAQGDALVDLHDKLKRTAEEERAYALTVQKTQSETETIVLAMHGNNITLWLAQAKKKYDGEVALIKQSRNDVSAALDAELEKFKATVDAEMKKREEQDVYSKAHFQKEVDDAQNHLDEMLRNVENYVSEDLRAARYDVEEKQRLLNHWSASAKEAFEQAGQAAAAAASNVQKITTATQQADAAMVQLTADELAAKKANLDMGGTIAVQPGSEEQGLAGGQITSETARPSATRATAATTGDGVIDGFLHDGFSLAQATALAIAQKYHYSVNMSQAPFSGGKGPRVPGFQEGGIGDFGTGTLAMLHGKEAIVPLDGGKTPGGTINITNYINDTAADVARQVAAELMRTLKSGRQFGAA